MTIIVKKKFLAYWQRIAMFECLFKVSFGSLCSRIIRCSYNLITLRKLLDLQMGVIAITLLSYVGCLVYNVIRIQSL